MRRATWAVFAGLLLVQTAWILAVAPFGGIDEPDHVYRAAAVARGQWLADGSVPDARGELVRVPKDLADAGRRECQALRYNRPANCLGVNRTATTVEVASGAGRYHPAYYWLIGTAARPFHGATAVYAMRAVSALMCTLLIVASGALLRRTAGAARWAHAGLVLALSPVALYSTALPAPNGPEIAAGLLLWTSLLSIGPVRARGDGWAWAAATLAAVMLVSMRSLGPLFALLIVALVVVVRRREVRAIIAFHLDRFLVALCVSAVAAVASVLWIVLQTPLGGAGGDHAHEPYSRLVEVLPTTILQSIAAAPARNDPAPALVYPLYLVLIVALLAIGVRRGRGSLRTALVAGVVLTLVVPLAVSAAGLHSVGLIWQGRYGLPLAVGVLVLAGLAVDEAARTTAGTRWLWYAAEAAYVVAQVLACVGAYRVEQGRPEAAGDPGWWQTSPWLVGALALAGAVLLAGTVVRSRVVSADAPAPA